MFKKIYKEIKRHWRIKKIPLCWAFRLFGKQVPKGLRGIIGTNTFDWKIDTAENPGGLIYAFQANNPDGLEVDWGDGNSDTINNPESTNVQISHTYEEAGEYTIKVNGNATRVTCGGRFSHSVLGWTSFGLAVTEVSSNPFDAITGITSMNYMFGYMPIENFDVDPNDWDTSNVTDMASVFRECDSFNQYIGDWDVSNVTAMDTMFMDTDFNQDIGNWDVSNVTSMNSTFMSSSFNQDIGGWDVSNVTLMFQMFHNASFDQDLSRWATSSISSEPFNFGNIEGTNPDWGTAKYPHIRFQEINREGDFDIDIFSDSGRTTKVEEITTNSRGYGQTYVDNDDTTFYYTADKAGYDEYQNDFSLGTCDVDDCRNTFHLELFSSDPGVITKSAEDIIVAGAKLKGELKEMGGETELDVYFEWGEDTDYGNTTTPQTLSSPGDFEAEIALTIGTQYHFRAVLTDGTDTWYGQNESFFTKYGEISGNVKLSVGVENATIRIVNQEGAYEVDVQTDGDGNYQYFFENAVDAGKKYHVIVEYEDGGTKYHAKSLWYIDPTNL